VHCVWRADVVACSGYGVCPFAFDTSEDLFGHLTRQLLVNLRAEVPTQLLGRRPEDGILVGRCRLTL